MTDEQISVFSKNAVNHNIVEMICKADNGDYSKIIYNKSNLSGTLNKVVSGVEFNHTVSYSNLFTYMVAITDMAIIMSIPTTDGSSEITYKKRIINPQDN